MSPEKDANQPDVSDAEDVALMLRVRSGEMVAFEALVERHQGRVVATVAKMLGHAADAEDVAQEVFVRVWRSAGRYEPTAKFTTWLFTIARNLVFNELRRRKRHPSVGLEAEEEARHYQTPDPAGVSPDGAMLDEEMARAVQAAIDTLPETQRMAVVLRRYEEMPYEEIGEVLGLTVPAVKSVLFRARTALRARLAAYLGE